jgi:hypothetical protein
MSLFDIPGLFLQPDNITVHYIQPVLLGAITLASFILPISYWGVTISIGAFEHTKAPPRPSPSATVPEELAATPTVPFNFVESLAVFNFCFCLFMVRNIDHILVLCH